MNNSPAQKEDTLEGEGSYSATRRDNQHLADALGVLTDSGDREASSEDAQEAMEGPERKGLERAADEGKRGPNKKGQTVAPTPKQAQAPVKR